MENVVSNDHCAPDMPGAGTDDKHMCDGTLRIECCCPMLRTRSFALVINPGNEAQTQTFLQNTISNYEAGGYLVLGSALTDIGAGWLLHLHIGWYA